MSDQKASSMIVHLTGAWQGEATDPARSFHGEVRLSELEALPVGAAVVVLYRDPGRRVTGAAEHGSYLLSAGDRDWPVSRFTLHAGSAGQTRDDRQPAAEWVAELLT